MQYPMLVTKLDSSQQTKQMPLSIGQTNGYGPVVQYATQISKGTLINQADSQILRSKGIDQFDYVLMMQTRTEELDFSDGGEVNSLLWTFGFDLFYGHDPTRLFVPGSLDDTPSALAEGLEIFVVLHDF